MVNSCCLPDCCSGCLGADKKISVFRTPRDHTIFEKWSSVLKKIHIDLKRNHFVCEKHFLNEDILREKVLRDTQGKIIFRKKFDRKRLRDGAVPFVDAPSLAAIAGNSIIPVPTKVANDEEALENNVTENLAIIKDFTAIDTAENVDKSVEFTDVELNKKPTLFDIIYDGIFKIKLPDSSWGIHMCDEPIKCVTFSQVEKCSDTDKVPTYVKQITLDAQLHVKLFVLHSKVAEKAATTVQEVQFALDELCNVQLCIGGPVIGTFKNVHPRCAYKDVIADRWRHNLCSLVTERLIICSKCRSLDKILRTHLDRKDKSKKLQIFIFPTRKQKIEIMRKAHRVRMQAFRRSKRKIEVIKLEVRELQNKVTEISEATCEGSINKLNLPHRQIMLIRECILVDKHALTNARRYTSEWFLTCLILQIRNPSTYHFLRKNQILPLPSRSTIQRYLGLSNLKCGFDENFFTAFRKKMQT